MSQSSIIPETSLLVRHRPPRSPRHDALARGKCALGV